MREEFYLAKDIPLPNDIDESIETLLNDKNSDLSQHWGKQLFDLQTLTRKCDGIQKIWDALTPESIKPATGNLKTATLAHLADSSGL